MTRLRDAAHGKEDRIINSVAGVVLEGLARISYHQRRMRACGLQPL